MLNVHFPLRAAKSTSCSITWVQIHSKPRWLLVHGLRHLYILASLKFLVLLENTRVPHHKLEWKLCQVFGNKSYGQISVNVIVLKSYMWIILLMESFSTHLKSSKLVQNCIHSNLNEVQHDNVFAPCRRDSDGLKISPVIPETTVTILDLVQTTVFTWLVTTHYHAS